MRWIDRLGSHKPQYQESTTNQWFSQFHRQLCLETSYMTDIDVLEYRYRDGQLVLVAILEIKHLSGNADQKIGASTLVARELARRAKVPFYIVFVHPEVGRAYTLCAHLPRRRDHGRILNEYNLPLESQTKVATLLEHSTCQSLSLIQLARWIDTLQEVEIA